MGAAGFARYQMRAASIKRQFATHAMRPLRNRIAFLSRRSQRPSIDFVMLANELGRRLPEWDIRMCCYDAHDSKRPHGRGENSLSEQVRLAATSRIVIVDGANPAVSVPKLRRGTIVIMLWPAFGSFNEFGWQAVGKRNGMSEDEARAFHLHRSYTTVVAAGPGIIGAMADAFHVDRNRIIPWGLPLMDYLQDDSPDALRWKRFDEVSEQYPSLTDGRPKILYAPTFRKGDGGSRAIVRETRDVARALQELPFDLYVYTTNRLDTSERFEGLELLQDVDPVDVLPAMDYVITDYSEIAFEAALAGKKVLFYCPDIREYRLESGLNVDPCKEFSSISFTHTDELREFLKTMIDSDPDRYSALVDTGDGLITQAGLAADPYAVNGHVAAQVAQAAKEAQEAEAAETGESEVPESASGEVEAAAADEGRATSPEDEDDSVENGGTAVGYEAAEDKGAAVGHEATIEDEGTDVTERKVGTSSNTAKDEATNESETPGNATAFEGTADTADVAVSNEVTTADDAATSEEAVATDGAVVSGEAGNVIMGESLDSQDADVAAAEAGASGVESKSPEVDNAASQEDADQQESSQKSVAVDTAHSITRNDVASILDPDGTGPIAQSNVVNAEADTTDDTDPDEPSASLASEKLDTSTDTEDKTPNTSEEVSDVETSSNIATDTSEEKSTSETTSENSNTKSSQQTSKKTPRPRPRLTLPEIFGEDGTANGIVEDAGTIAREASVLRTPGKAKGARVVSLPPIDHGRPTGVRPMRSVSTAPRSYRGPKGGSDAGGSPKAEKTDIQNRLEVRAMLMDILNDPTIVARPEDGQSAYSGVNERSTTAIDPRRTMSNDRDLAAAVAAGVYPSAGARPGVGFATNPGVQGGYNADIEREHGPSRQYSEPLAVGDPYRTGTIEMPDLAVGEHFEDVGFNLTPEDSEYLKSGFWQYVDDYLAMPRSNVTARIAAGIEGVAITGDNVGV